MSIGLIALLLAGVGAGWLLLRLAQGRETGGDRNMAILKVVIWLGLAGALFAFKLWPLALMVLLAAGGVMGIEAWRDKRVAEEEAANPRPQTLPKAMDAREAAAVLGIAADADAETIRAAHKKLIAQIHPDKGGTDYLAAKINEARDVLLKACEK